MSSQYRVLYAISCYMASTQWASEYVFDAIELCLKVLVPDIRDILPQELLHHVDAVLVIRNVVT